MTVQNEKKEKMNKFLLASIFVAASSTALLSACNNNTSKAPAETQAAAEAPAPETPAIAATPAEEQKIAQAEAQTPAKSAHPHQFLGNTGLVLEPGPVRLDKNGKPVHPAPQTPEERRQESLQMKADIEYLNAGNTPVTNEQRALARFTPHDRGLILKRINEVLAANHKG